MTAICISHRSSDHAEAQALEDWLGERGHEQLFLDFDPAGGIPAGVDREQRRDQELRRGQALLIGLTPAWRPDAAGTSSTSPPGRAGRTSSSGSSRAPAAR
ncbi:MAG: hypothetical protein ACREIR_07625 [Geminicoccaceae bacterium]